MGLQHRYDAHASSDLDRTETKYFDPFPGRRSERPETRTAQAGTVRCNGNPAKTMLVTVA